MTSESGSSGAGETSAGGCQPRARELPPNHITSLQGATTIQETKTATGGIRFNTLSPGPIDTPMLNGQAAKAQFAAAVPLNRLGRPEEIASAALFFSLR